MTATPERSLVVLALGRFACRDGSLDTAVDRVVIEAGADTGVEPLVVFDGDLR
jgi:hypothetical protein